MQGPDEGLVGRVWVGGGGGLVTFDNKISETCGLDFVLRDLEAVNVDKLSNLMWHRDLKRA